MSLAYKESYFIFNNFLHKQIDDVATGSPLGAILPTVLFWFYENKCLEKCPDEFKPIY